MKCKRLHILSGHSEVFDVYENFEFQQSYGHIPKSNYEGMARVLVNDWNRRGFMQGEQIYVYTIL